MSFDRRIQDRLYSAEQAEIIDSEAHFVADLRNLLDEKALTEGVHINLGDDPEVFQRALDLLGVDEAIGSSKYFNVVHGSVRSGSSISNMSHGRLSPVIEAHGVQGTVELMQTDEWKTTGDTFKRITTLDERVISWLMLVHGDNVKDDGTFDIDKHSTAVVAGVSARYQPECIDEYGENLGAPGLLEESSKVRDYRNGIAKFGELLDYQEGTLELPSKNYFIRIGQCLHGDGTPAAFGFSPVDVYPRHGFYDLKDGRIVQSAE